jgi:hypothetical protein
LWHCEKSAGSVWGVPLKIVGGGENPVLVVEPDGTLHAAFEAMGNNDIYYLFRPVGDTWSQAMNVSNNSGYSRCASLAVDSSGGVHLVWLEVFEGQSYYAFKPSGDSLFQPAEVLSDVSGDPQLDSEIDGHLHVAWVSSGDVYYIHKQPSGNWSSAENISNTTGTTWGIPHLAHDSDGRIHIVWSEDAPDNPEIYYDVLP